MNRTGYQNADHGAYDWELERGEKWEKHRAHEDHRLSGSGRCYQTVKLTQYCHYRIKYQ